MKDALPTSNPDPKAVSPAIVEKSVVNNIYGGNILIASHAENISQIAHTTVAAGDTAALKEALKKLGITDEGIEQLESDIKADQKDGSPSIGKRVKGWIANVGSYVGKEGAKAGIDVVKKFATKWILQHFGLDPG
jgi:hypothetical protein